MGTVAVPKNQAIPAVVQTTLRKILDRFKFGPSSSLLPFIPKPLKLILLLLVLVNSPSFPFQWHLRVWSHALKAYWLVYRKGRAKYLRDWETENVALGQVRNLRTRIKRVAWLDDCDYNLHLSNSCYAKNSDPARMDYCVQSVSPIFTPGATMALAGTHYNFIKEIPMGSEYVMETRAVGWGEKWIYFVTEFIIYPKSKPTANLTAAKAEISAKISSAPTSSAGPIIPSISTPGTGENTPQDTSRSASPMPSMEEAKKAAVRARRRGLMAALWRVLLSLSIASRWAESPFLPIALYFSFQSPTVEGREHAKRLISAKDKGRGWLRGGWKDEPNASELGKDIGVREDEQDSEAWYEKTKKGMEEVAAGLSGL